jgi:hypothetical protein
MLMAGSCSVLLNLHPVEILYCMGAAALPDQLETIGRVRIIAHRTLTHELLVWLIPLFFMMFFSNHLPALSFSIHYDRIPVSLQFRPWTLFLPGVLHLAGDILTHGGIRIAGRKTSFRLFLTGQPAEYILTAIFVVLAGAHMFPGLVR